MYIKKILTILLSATLLACLCGACASQHATCDSEVAKVQPKNKKAPLRPAKATPIRGDFTRY